MAISMVFMVKSVSRHPRYGTSLGRDIIMEGPRPNADYIKLRLPYGEIEDWTDYQPGKYVRVTIEEIEESK